MSETIAVAMSGGLDSSVAAWVLSRQPGRRVIGLSMLLWDAAGESGDRGRCCGALDLGDARRVASQCGVPHYTLRMEQPFREHVVDPFVDDYLSGRTPVPCTRCNTWIKFDLFLRKAKDAGAERMATGHYARIVEGDDGRELHAAADGAKDQSYYLFELSQAQLAATLFPLGEMTKEEARDIARQAGLLVAEKPESMELCFVSSGVREFVEAAQAADPNRFGAVDGGGAELVDSTGRVMGRGEPYYRYTVGQRRGLGVSAGDRLYVLGIQPESNRVVVGGPDELLAAGLTGERVHWIGRAPSRPLEVSVKIRARHVAVTALVTPCSDAAVEVEFRDPQSAVTPGQAAVFYRGTRVLGGCWIRAARPVASAACA